jgi:uncharacterized protein (TIGR02147 family)
VKAQRPDIYAYHDYRVFLTDWFAYRKASQSEFSLRWLAKQAGLASGYLSMVVNRKRPLAGAAAAKLLPLLGLLPAELSFLESLLTLGNSDSHEARVAALERMRRFRGFQKGNPQDADAYEYLTHWYFVAIREMASLPGFRPEAGWIQERLRFAVPLKGVKAALAFLLNNGYVQILADGTARLPEKDLNCGGGIYRLALAKFHREVLGLAGQSIEAVAGGEREIQGHTCALSQKKFAQAKAIVDEAMAKVRALEASEGAGQSVYHLEIALFPMTKEKDAAASAASKAAGAENDRSVK